MPAALTGELQQQSLLLQWSGENPTQEPLRFAVYRFGKNEKINLDKAENIISVQTEISYTDRDYQKYPGARYVVTVLDRLWNESPPTNITAANNNK